MRISSCLFSLVLIAGSIHLQGEEVVCTFREKAEEKPALTLYYVPWCYYCHKVINYLKRINKQIPLKDIQDPGNREELITIGGMSQVPCLVIGDEALYESSDIIAWLSARQDLLEDIPK